MKRFDDEAWNKKMHNHRHNALYGSTSHARRNMYSIVTSASTTPKAKELADKIATLLADLGTELYNNRVELDGTLVHPRHKGAEYIEALRKSVGVQHDGVA